VPAAGATSPAAEPVTLEAEALREACLKADDGGKGRARAVLSVCRPAFKAAPESVELMVILARAELDRGRTTSARSWAKKAIAANPGLADAYVYLGGAEQEAGDTKSARAAYEKYLELAPSGRYARELRAILDSL
jgi:Flp pilus assembly protein TadD